MAIQGANFQKGAHQRGSNTDTQVGDPGTGGGMAFGFSGVLLGTATCFCAFMGFNLITTTVCKSGIPKAIPVGIKGFLLECFLASGVLAVPTLVVCASCRKDSHGLRPLVTWTGIVPSKWWPWAPSVPSPSPLGFTFSMTRHL